MCTEEQDLIFTLAGVATFIPAKVRVLENASFVHVFGCIGMSWANSHKLVDYSYIAQYS